MSTVTAQQATINASAIDSGAAEGDGVLPSSHIDSPKVPAGRLHQPAASTPMQGRPRLSRTGRAALVCANSLGRAVLPVYGVGVVDGEVIWARRQGVELETLGEDVRVSLACLRQEVS
jgi:hypothetical protein